MKVVYDIFVDSGVLTHFKIEERKAMAFIAAVASHYHSNPYHNFVHVTYVLHCVYMIMSTSEAAKCLTRTDQLVLLIAALCHDIDHDGMCEHIPLLHHTTTVTHPANCTRMVPELSPLASISERRSVHAVCLILVTPLGSRIACLCKHPGTMLTAVIYADVSGYLPLL